MRTVTLLAIALATVAACAKGGAPSAAGDGGVTGGSDAAVGADADASCGNLCDSDGDGVPDPMDQCPNTPPGEPVNKVGCSDSQLQPGLNPMFPPYGLSWAPTGDPGRAGGLIWSYVGINRGDLFHIWWIVCDDPATPCGVTLDGATVGATEGWQYDAADSNLAGGTLVETNATRILLADGSTPPLTGRLTLKIFDSTQTPIPIGSVGSLGVPARAGGFGAEIKGTGFAASILIEVQASGTTTWTPYLDYYDAAMTPPTGGSSAVSFGGSFYDK